MEAMETKHPERRTLARNLRKLREERGWYLTEAANRCGVARETIRRYETETRRGGAYSAALTKVARGYGVAVCDLWRGDEDGRGA